MQRLARAPTAPGYRPGIRAPASGLRPGGGIWCSAVNRPAAGDCNRCVQSDDPHNSTGRSRRQKGLEVARLVHVAVVYIGFQSKRHRAVQRRDRRRPEVGQSSSASGRALPARRSAPFQPPRPRPVARFQGPAGFAHQRWPSRNTFEVARCYGPPTGGIRWLGDLFDQCRPVSYRGTSIMPGPGPRIQAGGRIVRMKMAHFRSLPPRAGSG